MDGKSISPIDDKFLNFTEVRLPKISFTEFNTFRLKDTELLWVNRELVKKYNLDEHVENIESYILSRYSYVTSDYAKIDRLNIDDSKIFWADRYGSRHEVCNGGSARCGFDGLFQVKGIGITPLLARNIDQSHANGKLFLDEAILEAIWGEICHKNLPYGAVRTLAIIKTNIFEDFLYSNNKPKKPCALAIREFAIRPAHFERATFFWPFDKFILLRENDADRVRDSLNYLPISLGLCDKYISSGSLLVNCFNLLIRRLAKQIAYSRIKGIPHGSLTSSNISIDGRFLDFGTITAVPDFGNYVLAEGVGAVWDDHVLVANWLDNLAITVRKYSKFGNYVPDSKVLITLFFDELDYHENYSILEELDVKDKNENNLYKAKEIKSALISTKRKQLGDFSSDKFRERLADIALEKKLKIGKINFELRDFKYSSFNILNDEDIKSGDLSKEVISTLINKYS